MGQEMSASSGRNRCITLIWRIENFSNCLHRKGQSFTSPRLGVSDEGIGEWELVIYPRGKQREGYIDFDIVRFANEGGYTVQCEFSLLATDGTPFFAREGYGGWGPWEWYATDFVKRTEVEAMKSTLLPQDTLTVRCCVWGRSVHPRGPETHIARTRIVEPGDKSSCNFTSSFENFTSSFENFTSLK